jgi:uncharacterized membrane protein YidH (DUF202 family)
MSNLSEIILGGLLTAIPIILIVMKPFALESITNIFKAVFTRITDKTIVLLLNVIIALLLFVGILVIMNVINNQQNNKKNITEETQYQKSDAQVILEGAELGIKILGDGIARQRKKNEEIIKNRDNRYVFQIGDIKNNKESVFDSYKRMITNADIDSSIIYVFEIKKSKYFLYCEIKDMVPDTMQLQRFKERIKPVETYIKMIDIHSYCSARENIEKTKPLKYRKYAFTIPKCKCGK